jgi:hypothetical protein
MAKARLFVHSNAHMNVPGYEDIDIFGGKLSVSGSTANINAISDPIRHTVDAAAQLVLPSNSNREGFRIQNVGTSVIKGTLGSIDPTQTVFHFILPAGGTTNDGSSPPYESFLWSGEVRVISSVDGGAVVVAEYT